MPFAMHCAAFVLGVFSRAAMWARTLFRARAATVKRSLTVPVYLSKGKPMSKILCKADILAASDLTTEQVEVPEWGGAVIIRGMTGTQRDAYENSLMVKDADGKYRVDTENMRVKLVLYCAVDEAGKQLFDASELTALAGKSAAVIERLFTAAQNINGLNKGAVDEAVKNSASVQPVSSVSA
jgi:hypothetical protein